MKNFNVENELASIVVDSNTTTFAYDAISIRVKTAHPGGKTSYFPLRQAQVRLFGDWRVEPAHALTDQGFTGHKHNDDLGLVYMNARFYISSIGRFASADTIVPDPMNPQQFNRYTYTLNNPLRFTDPTGHCAQEDHECWHYLENDFCQAVDCNGGDWKTWLIYGQWGTDRPYAFAEPWTIGELGALADQLQMAIDALGQAGINWTQTPLANVKIGLISANRSSYFGIPSLAGEILMTRSQLMNYRTLHHEIGHAFGLQRAFEEATNGGCAIICKRYAAYGTYFREYGRSGNDLFFRAHETWADAFSVFVFTMTYDRTPRSNDTGWSVIDMSLLVVPREGHLDSIMLYMHTTTQNILVSRYGYGR